MGNSKAKSEVFPTTRKVAEFITDSGLKKEDIIAVLPIGGQIFLIYYA